MDEFLMTERDPHMVIGVSGGADSICLLFLMKETLGAERIRVVHINHMIRGEEADEDSSFVKSICEREGILFTEVKKDIPALSREMGYSEEEAGRRIRYECFEAAAAQWEEECSLAKGSVRIAVAHHIEDNAETVLFNLFRGTGIRGLSGIAPERGRIIRPLLGCSRKDIEEYLRDRGENFRIDRTNEDTAYARNRIRNLILPQAEEVSSLAAEHIASASGKLRSILEYLDCEVDRQQAELVTAEDGSFRVNKQGLCKLPEVIASMLVLRLLTELTPMKKDIGEVHADMVLELAAGSAGKHSDLPYGIEADVSHDEILLRRRSSSDRVEPVIETEVLYLKANDLSAADIAAITDPACEGNRYTKYFDCDKISFAASAQGIDKEPFFEIRKRRDGDFLKIRKADGSLGTKFVGDYLTDLKLSVTEKENIFVFAAGKEVLWVIGYRMSDTAKLSDDTVNILRLECRPAEN